MAIGDYWACVLPEGEDIPPLQRIVGESTMLARQHFSSWRFEPGGHDLGGAEFAFKQFAAGEMRAAIHLVKPVGRPNFYLHSAFPWLAAGAPIALTVYRVDADHFGLEGFVDAGIPDGPAITFFDPLFAINKDKYRHGAEYNFALGAVSLDLGDAAPGLVRMRNPEVSGPDYVEVDTSRAKILVRAAQNTSDYYLFQGPVRTVRSAVFLDRPFLVFRTAVVDLGGDDLAVDIYMDRGRFRGRHIPAEGDVVSGRLWLQGSLVARQL